ncbi:MAG: ROK family protein [Opitutaceae bacterium]|jgi:polyphosphate glucokinase|nr:ROK family protein [Opitutaceae bacterium]
MNTLGIDIGGSAVKGAPVDTKTGKLLAERLRIEAKGKLTPAQLAAAVAEITRHFRWRGPIGAGFPGVIHGSTIATSANLSKRFIGCDLAALIAGAAATRATVRVINDADAAGIAEMRFGAGRGRKDSVLVLTLGTGVGSAMFFNGQLFPNTEFGHLPSGGHSIEKDVAAAARKLQDLSWSEWGRRLGDYIRTLEKLVAPACIIIGGGVSARHEKFFKYLKTRAPVVPAEFLNEAGIAGAALHAAAAGEGAK